MTPPLEMYARPGQVVKIDDKVYDVVTFALPKNGEQYIVGDEVVDCLVDHGYHPEDQARPIVKLRQDIGPPPAEASDTKPTNPKDAIGSDKLPLHLWPASATVFGSLGLLDGMLKYGRSNWREAGVRATIYLDALERHVKAWSEGEDLDPDSGLPHLSHALACLAILVDAGTAGKLVDDRNFNGAGYRPLVEDMTSHVPRLKAKHAGRDPKHYTIGDN